VTLQKGGGTLGRRVRAVYDRMRDFRRNLEEIDVFTGSENRAIRRDAARAAKLTAAAGSPIVRASSFVDSTRIGLAAAAHHAARR
jgi:hypothetical protein